MVMFKATNEPTQAFQPKTPTQTSLTAISRPVLTVSNIFGLVAVSIDGCKIKRQASFLLRLWHYLWILFTVAVSSFFYVARFGDFIKAPKACLGPRFDALTMLVTDLCYTSMILTFYFVGAVKAKHLEEMSEKILDIEGRLTGLMHSRPVERPPFYSQHKKVSNSSFLSLSLLCLYLYHRL